MTEKMLTETLCLKKKKKKKKKKIAGWMEKHGDLVAECWTPNQEVLGFKPNYLDWIVSLSKIRRLSTVLEYIESIVSILT